MPISRLAGPVSPDETGHTSQLRDVRGGELVLTRAVAADPEVAALLNDRRIESEVVPADLGEPTHVIRVRLDAGEVGSRDA